VYDSVQAQQDYLCIVAPLSAEVQVLRGVSCPQVSKLQITLPEIRCHDRLFAFHKPIMLLLYLDEGVWVCECCGIVSAGCNPTEAAFSFCEDFSTFWDEIAQLPDSRLTKKAQATKNCMLSAVKSVR
jgi:hypothetical protein